MVDKDHILAVDFDKFLHEALDRVEQHSTVEEFFHHSKQYGISSQRYNHSFQKLILLSQFVYGLCADIRGYVLRFKPITVIDVFYLACVYEHNFSFAFNHVDYVVDIVSVESMGTMETELAVRDLDVVAQHTDEETNEALQCDIGFIHKNISGEFGPTVNVVSMEQFSPSLVMLAVEYRRGSRPIDAVWFESVSDIDANVFTDNTSTLVVLSFGVCSSSSSCSEVQNIRGVAPMERTEDTIESACVLSRTRITKMRLRKIFRVIGSNMLGSILQKVLTFLVQFSLGMFIMGVLILL